jgi:hypothetical protein
MSFEEICERGWLALCERYGVDPADPDAPAAIVAAVFPKNAIAGHPRPVSPPPLPIERDSHGPVTFGDDPAGSATPYTDRLNP